MAETQPESLAGIDAARGFAALAVFVYHYNIGLVIQKATGAPVSGAFAIVGAEYAVPLFFLISGFCIHLSQLRQASRTQTRNFRLGDYLRRRFWRIYPAYAAALALSIAMTALTGGAVGLKDVFIHILMLHGVFSESFNTFNLVLWSVSIETLLYLAYPVWLVLRRWLGLDAATAVAFAVSAVSCGACALWLYPYSVSTRWAVTNVWFGWVFGAWLAERWMMGGAIFRNPSWRLFGVLSLAAYAAALALHLFDGRGLILKPPAIIVCWAFPLTLMLRGPSWRAANGRGGRGIGLVLVRPLVVVGAFSYSLYLLHEPLLQLRDLLWAPVSSPALRSLIWIAWFGLTLAASWGWFKLFEQPFMHLRRPLLAAPVTRVEV